MLHYWTDQGDSAIRTTAQYAKTFSLNILTSAGFGKSYSFKPSSHADNGTNHSMSYKDSLSLIVGNAIPILIIGPAFLQKCKRFLPKSWQDVAQATVEFKSTPNLMTFLVRASQSNFDSKIDDSSLGCKQYALTEEEIFGNMFVFNFARHDTISHTICRGHQSTCCTPRCARMALRRNQCGFLGSRFCCMEL
ncbi:b856f28b-ac1f-444b-9b81-435060da19ba-CDS [Sclerotinia trifoliorum]|uniref:B856f28b-ac1f-444b-9b81-435060da19ba-CDS n=1 Tax=Sclerotinia trifoliorum TaxID=28548 RepID=A0A8H2ZNX3_9HELO|nr:b856f28b-ac1f-444b-9b81-435060da19ba-CDS [Sclerotinia trifoliorum]